jgi:hypothetical protein
LIEGASPRAILAKPPDAESLLRGSPIADWSKEESLSPDIGSRVKNKLIALASCQRSNWMALASPPDGAHITGTMPVPPGGSDWLGIESCTRAEVPAVVETSIKINSPNPNTTDFNGLLWRVRRRLGLLRLTSAILK